MTSITNTYNHTQVNEGNTSLRSRYNTLIKKLEFSHYSIIVLSILVASCLGAITTMQIFENNAPIWQFMISVGFTMANLVACIGQAPTKWVVNLFTATVLVNILLLVINLV